MHDDAATDRLARFYLAEHASGAAHRPLPDALMPVDLDAAYEAQRALVEHWRQHGRGPVGGYKIALTSQAMQEMCGVDRPCVGTVFAAEIERSPARIDLGAYRHLGLEFELCFRIARALPRRDVDYDAQTVRDAVDSVVPAFELIDDRDADYRALDARDLVADNTWSAGIVLGESDGDWRALDLSANPVELEWNDEREHATTGAALGNPLEALAWVANHQARSARALARGDWVMTGSTMRTRFPVAGDTACYRVRGLGEVRVQVAA